MAEGWCVSADDSNEYCQHEELSPKARGGGAHIFGMNSSPSGFRIPVSGWIRTYQKAQIEAHNMGIIVEPLLPAAEIETDKNWDFFTAEIETDKNWDFFTLLLKLLAKSSCILLENKQTYR